MKTTKKDQLEEYVDALFNFLDAPLKPDAPLSEEEHREIERDYKDQLNQDVKSYYNPETKRNTVEFINYKNHENIKTKNTCVIRFIRKKGNSRRAN
ncbi:hypothetical protein [Chryseobacterium indologenes]|uniref:hypothetical protein n=1 Tax=Chryseobacterium indologenes TaxID=253 RepID=UPI000A812865|nr:hypothetical protein [Chryseobacterium indologenes]